MHEVSKREMEKESRKVMNGNMRTTKKGQEI